MSKPLSLTGMVIAGLVGVVFLADLAVGFPFARASLVIDICLLIASLILGYLAWTVMPVRR